jgi:hypothetical protein
MLLVFAPSGDSYSTAYACEAQAASVMDGEACRIHDDYIARYFSYSSYSNAQVLGSAFSSTSFRIMTATSSPWAVFLVAAAAAVVLIFFFVRRKKKEREAKAALDAQQVEEMLKIPLEKFGDQDIEELAKKYEDKE